MRTRGYETLRLTRSVLASAAPSDPVRFIHESIFESCLNYNELGLPCRRESQSDLARSRTRRTAFAVAPSPYGAYDAEQ